MEVDQSRLMLRAVSFPDGTTVAVRGFFYRYQGDRYAIYVANDQLFLMTDDSEWPISGEGIELKYRRILFLEFFSITENGRAVFSRHYWQVAALRGVITDPTFDRIDEHHIYFLEWCYDLSRDPGGQLALIDRWKSWQRTTESGGPI